MSGSRKAVISCIIYQGRGCLFITHTHTRTLFTLRDSQKDEEAEKSGSLLSCCRCLGTPEYPHRVPLTFSAERVRCLIDCTFAQGHRCAENDFDDNQRVSSHLTQGLTCAFRFSRRSCRLHMNSSGQTPYSKTLCYLTTMFSKV